MPQLKSITRRQFIRGAGVTAAGAVLASCNLPVKAPTAEPTEVYPPAASPTIFVKPTAIRPIATKNVPTVDMRPIIKNIG